MKRTKNRTLATVRIHDEIDGLWEKMTVEAFPSLRGAWRPLYDLFITRNRLVLIVEVPGVEKDDMTISISPRGVLVQGRRKAVKLITEGKIFYNLEIPYGRFERRIPFPIEVQVNKVKIKVANGLVTLTFPLMPRDRQRIVPVEEAKS